MTEQVCTFGTSNEIGIYLLFVESEKEHFSAM